MTNHSRHTLILKTLLPALALLAPALTQAAPDAKALYSMYCVQCHGSQGDGKGVNASHLNVQPRSHIDRTEMAARSDEELFKVIAEGGSSINKSILMPSWRHNLNEEEIHALVAHLRELCCQN